MGRATMVDAMKESASNKGGGRAEEVVKVAADLFLQHGFERVSIDTIITAVGGSKRDLYAEFGGKEGLFRRVIAGICQDIMNPLRALPTDGTSVEEALTTFGLTFLRFLLTPRVVSLQRLVMSEASRHPEFAKTFFQHGPLSAYTIASELLLDRARKGEVDVKSPRILGAMFCDMLIADLQFRTVAGEKVSAKDVLERVSLAVSVLLNGIMTHATRPELLNSRGIS